MSKPGPGPSFPDARWLSAWAERRPSRTASERTFAKEYFSRHLPEASEGAPFSDADMDAIKAAFIMRFDEDLPRTETLMAVAMIGYRIALARAVKGAPDER